MSLREEQPTGSDYLATVSRLLQRVRSVDPYGGLWEAADLQWWWRVDQHDDPVGQSVWFDRDDAIVAAIFTRWKRWMGCDLLGTDAAVDRHAALIWDRLADRFLDVPVSMMIRDDDRARIHRAEDAGFRKEDDRFATAWMAPSSRPSVPPLPAGLRIVPYDGGRHPMEARNGDVVASRLAECPLYRPDLDLSIRDGDAVAGYALFWADPITGVGLLEPMRIEDEYQGRGLSKALLAAGLERLARAGCTRFKVSFEPANAAATRLYTGAGFRPRFTARSWIRAPAR
jgi:GNAT superfamily N-acetyltransferase